MNYLTAIVAVPLFVAVWVFELWLVRNANFDARHKGKVRVCLAVSTLQMISCWFWLLGFVFSTTDNVLSEAMGPGEEMNCFGLVGAEVLLAIFQLMFSMLTVFLAIYLRKVSKDAKVIKNAKKSALTAAERWTFGSISCFLGIYTLLAWATALNRRCPQNEMQPLIELQHHFYPIYLLVDSVATTTTYSSVRAILLQAETIDKTVKTRSSGTSAVRKMAIFFRTQCKLTFAGCGLACGIFVLQFTVKLKALSLIACVFCVLMYITYAMRRVQLLSMWCRFDLRKRQYLRSSRQGKATVTPYSEATQSSNVQSSQNKASSTSKS